MIKAEDVLDECLDILDQRGAEYDNEGNAFDYMAANFNNISGKHLSRSECCLLMVSLKLSRLRSQLVINSYEGIYDTIIDTINYLALYLENTGRYAKKEEQHDGTDEQAGCETTAGSIDSEMQKMPGIEQYQVDAISSRAWGPQR